MRTCVLLLLLLPTVALADPDLYGDWRGTSQDEYENMTADLSLSQTGEFVLVLVSELIDPATYWGEEFGMYAEIALPDVIVVEVTGTWQTGEDALVLKPGSVSLQMNNEELVDEIVKATISLILYMDDFEDMDDGVDYNSPLEWLGESFTDEEIDTFFAVFRKLFLYSIGSSIIQEFEEAPQFVYHLAGDVLKVWDLISVGEILTMQRTGPTAVMATSWGQVKARSR